MLLSKDAAHNLPKIHAAFVTGVTSYAALKGRGFSCAISIQKGTSGFSP